VLTLETVTRGEGFTVSVVTCRDDHTRWSAPEVREGYELVLPRHGRFRRKANGRVDDIDPTMAYLGAPGVEQQFAHPAGGDVCTLVQFEPELWKPELWPASRPETVFRIDANAQLSHRRLLNGEAEEPLLDLIQQVTGARPVEPSTFDDKLVIDARDAVLAGVPEASSLRRLATALDVSPYRLSRSFSRITGHSYTDYRNRVRLNRMLDRLAEGETRLGVLAADLGFADQAHLTRTVRRYFDRAPTVLRKILNPRNG
jgi:AraC-like DNA-binding protein